MSVDNDEQKLQEEDASAEVSIEQLAESGDEAAEGLTQDSPEVEIEAVEVGDLLGTQPKENEKEEKELNRLYAENRVKTKQLKQLESQIEQGVIPESYAFKPQEVSEKPKLQDFVNETRLYEEFNGNEAIALAAFNEAKEDWATSNQSVDIQREAHIGQTREQIQAQIAQEEAFESSIVKHRKVVKGLDQSLENAEKLLGESEFLIIRDTIGNENAPLVLAVLGSNARERQDLFDAADKAAMAGNPVDLIKHLTLLEQRVVSNLPSAKTISTAASETPVDGGGNIGDGTEKILRDIDSGKGKYAGMSRFDRAKEKRNVQRERKAAS